VFRGILELRTKTAVSLLLMVAVDSRDMEGRAGGDATEIGGAWERG